LRKSIVSKQRIHSSHFAFSVFLFDTSYITIHLRSFLSHPQTRIFLSYKHNFDRSRTPNFFVSFFSLVYDEIYSFNYFFSTSTDKCTENEDAETKYTCFRYTRSRPFPSFDTLARKLDSYCYFRNGFLRLRLIIEFRRVAFIHCKSLSDAMKKYGILMPDVRRRLSLLFSPIFSFGIISVFFNAVEMMNILFVFNLTSDLSRSRHDILTGERLRDK